MRFQKLEAEKSCADFCEIWLPEKQLSVTQRPLKIFLCLPNSGKKKSRNDASTQNRIHRPRHYGKTDGQEPHEGRVFARRAQPQSSEGRRTGERRRNVRRIAEGSGRGSRCHHHDVAELTRR